MIRYDYSIAGLIYKIVMNFNELDYQNIDPRSAKNDPWFFKVLEQSNFIPHFQPKQFDDPSSNKTIHYNLTFPVFRFEKPERKSTKSKQIKPKGTYYAVYDPKPLGQGSYGAVYPVIGVWTFKNNGWVFKTKNNPEKKRVVKIFTPDPQKPNAENIFQYYCDEQQIGQYTPHMGYTYKPVKYQNDCFLLMREQPGITLEALLEQAKKTGLSVTERLNISVSLLQQLHHQIHAVVVPDQGNIVHRDLKPSNILVDQKKEVNFIDYGLAKTSHMRENKVVGTPIFTDPFLYSGPRKQINTDNDSDLASIGFVLASLWGDTSRDTIKSPASLHEHNQASVLIGFLSNIPSLTHEERMILHQTIHAMIQFDKTKRLTREFVLAQFEYLLNKRLAREKIEQDNEQERLRLLATQTPLNQLQAKQLLALLTSPHKSLILDRFSKEPGSIPFLTDMVSDVVLALPDETLQKLAKMGVPFASFEITPSNLRNKLITAEKVKLLLQLGARLDPVALQNWINQISERDHEYKWISICRVLYENTANADAHIPSRGDNTFKDVFFVHFLKNKETAVDDKHNVRLIKRHIEQTNHRRSLISLIKLFVGNNYSSAPLKKAIFLSPLMNPSSSHLLLAKQPDYFALQVQLTELHGLDRASQKTPDEEMPLRKQEIAAIKALLNQIKNRTTLDDWQQVPVILASVKQKLKKIHVIDAMLIEFDQVVNTETLFKRLKAELDQIYAQEAPDFELLAKQKTQVLQAILTKGQVQVESVHSPMVETVLAHFSETRSQSPQDSPPESRHGFFPPPKKRRIGQEKSELTAEL